MRKTEAISLGVAALLTLASLLPAQRGRGGGPDTAAINAVKRRYEKLEVRIPMRDGARLFTTIYVPRDTTRSHPFLMTRTPYGIGAPDGSYRASLGLGPRYMDAGMIFVAQDARGRYYSEGDFTEMTPHKDKKTAKDVDESTDTYDTIDWLLKNVPHNNGRVGIYGTSYPGFYTTASCIDPPPALKACRPGSPMTDLYFGDDLFHNGAFYLGANFSFYQGFGRTPRNPELGPDPRPSLRLADSIGTDAYKFYLGLGPIGSGSRKWLPRETAPLWDLVMQHPNYDAFWQARDIRRHLRRVAPAMLETGGFYDAEDLFGPFGTFRAIEQGPSRAGNHLAMGPWSHGGWAGGDGDRLATLRWEAKSGLWFRDSVEFPFFLHHLAGGPDPKLPKVLIFRTGADRWDRYDAWPPPGLVKKGLYLHPGSKLAFEAPKGAGAAYDEYVSDPANPVPVVGYPSASGMPREYMVGDQRFASKRADVLTYVSDVLTSDVTIVGPVSPVLHVATSGTDGDFDVKLIDVWPDDAPAWPGDTSGFQVAGYQQMVRGEPFRGKFRRSFERPLPFVPNQPDSLRFEMPDINHTFRKGHRIMVQVQSSWFPLTDRNPQTFVPNIFEAKPEDFVKATMRVYHAPGRASRLEVRVLP
ncbi:MAG TPA: CocE/NonD family hydrolase [Gemmatimonadaceae bacterium]|nr:CocE/NonD family hydrolase [Gemmatimonadaceae bacterium]